MSETLQILVTQNYRSVIQSPERALKNTKQSIFIVVRILMKAETIFDKTGCKMIITNLNYSLTGNFGRKLAF